MHLILLNCRGVQEKTSNLDTLIVDSAVLGSAVETPGLKDVNDIVKEIESAIERINTLDRRKSLEDSLEPLRMEPSLSNAPDTNLT